MTAVLRISIIKSNSVGAAAGAAPISSGTPGARDPESFAPNRPPHIHIYAAHDRAVQDVTIFVQEVSYDQPDQSFALDPVR